MNFKKQILLVLTSALLAGVFYLGWRHWDDLRERFFPAAQIARQKNSGNQGDTIVPPLVNPVTPRNGSAQFEHSSMQSYQNVQRNLHAVNEINHMNQMNRVTQAPDVVEKQ